MFARNKKDDVLGRIYTVHLRNTEWYYLHLILHDIRGPISFKDLKTIEGIEHPII